MKIVCNKNEFALLVRACECNIISDTCNGCLFFGLCCAPEAAIDGVEEICEISDEE